MGAKNEPAKRTSTFETNLRKENLINPKEWKMKVIGWTLGAFAANLFGRVPFMLCFLMHDYLSALTWVVAGTVMCIWKKIEGSL